LYEEEAKLTPEGEIIAYSDSDGDITEKELLDWIGKRQQVVNSNAENKEGTSSGVKGVETPSAVEKNDSGEKKGEKGQGQETKIPQASITSVEGKDFTKGGEPAPVSLYNNVNI
jgi:hypothetical protein